MPSFILYPLIVPVELTFSSEHQDCFSTLFGLRFGGFPIFGASAVEAKELQR